MELPVKMFAPEIYRQRRLALQQNIEGGLLIFIGNRSCPINFSANPYPFRQDSTFLYYWGIDQPNLAALIDLDKGQEVLFGDEPGLEDIIWTGYQPSLQDKAFMVGCKHTKSFEAFAAVITQAVKDGRTIHYLPYSRQSAGVLLSGLIGLGVDELNGGVSGEFTKAVVRQRSVKHAEEIEQIESALELTAAMHKISMARTRPGVYEREVVGAMVAEIYSSAAVLMAYGPIFTRNGQIMHNSRHCCQLVAGDLVINDSGAESPMHYASDITRSLPVSGRFDERQKQIYMIVFQAMEAAIGALKPGVAFVDLHLLAASVLTEGLVGLGLMRGDVRQIVNSGAHALFFPVGLGHMLGLDVHDMEDLGEDLVGYNESFRRDMRFGFCNLRLAKELLPGYVVTIEPGIYFIEELIRRWKSEDRFVEYINYSEVEKWIGFGGLRLEDNVLVTETGNRILGPHIPKTIQEVEAAMAE